MLVISSILTLDMGLVDTMLSSFRGYWAPECMTIAALGFCCGNVDRSGVLCWRRWQLSLLGQHPLVLGTAPALIWLWWEQSRRSEFWWVSVGMSVVLFAPDCFGYII